MRDTLLPTVAVVCPDPSDSEGSLGTVRRLFGYLDEWESLVKPTIGPNIGPNIGPKIGPGAEVLLLVSLRRMHDLSYLQLVSDTASLVIEAGGEVAIGDSPWLASGRVEEYWRSTGLAQLAAARGWRLVNFEKEPRGEVAAESRVYYLPEAVLAADVSINIAPALRHRRCGLAAGIFNLLGVIPGYKPGQFPDGYGYRDVFSDVAVDLLSFVSPDLTLVDLNPGSNCTEAGFDCRRRVIGSTDAVAVDAVVASALGLSPGEPSAVRLAADAGLGIGWLEGIELVGDPVYPLLPEVLAPFAGYSVEKLPSLVARAAAPFSGCRMEVDLARCEPCEMCQISCPTGALRTCDDSRVVYSEALCVTCLRCREVCPKGAIMVARKWLS